jgi:hypothetical protein
MKEWDQRRAADVPANAFFFLDLRDAERKTTGSYYTHPSLVNELIMHYPLSDRHEPCGLGRRQHLPDVVVS